MHTFHRKMNATGNKFQEPKNYSRLKFVKRTNQTNNPQQTRTPLAGAVEYTGCISTEG